MRTSGGDTGGRNLGLGKLLEGKPMSSQPAVETGALGVTLGKQAPWRMEQNWMENILAEINKGLAMQ